ncbi:gap junction delta-3 protein [Pteronotus mesoamericanus]|uniref:gap junction delta-3 protein n=1 Tax=Pteronotus mesoamericanus TaxID=1884717 RepID=UPI0023EDB90F|nr:gap junction delta-3 protein [Pteronotus parnellii mesoamericanus]
MGEWAFLGSLLDAVQLQSPLVGRLWLVVMLIFRILVLASVGGAVFEDEQEEFVCNTLQPGCRQTCYDRAFPISHYRFWLFHILLLSAPSVLFVIYSMHQASKDAARAPRAGRTRCCYLASVVGRLLLEAAFLACQWRLYGFRVAPHFACSGPPCPHTVDCFVSRPTEKTVFVVFYFVVGLLSAVLSVAELSHLLWKGRPRQTAERDNGCNAAREEAQKLLLPPPPPPPPPPPALPARRPGPDPYAPPAYAHRAPAGDSEGGSGRSAVSLASARQGLAI